MIKKDYFWPLLGLAAVAFSVYVLLEQLKDISYDDVVLSLEAISLHGWLMAASSDCLCLCRLSGLRPAGFISSAQKGILDLYFYCLLHCLRYRSQSGCVGILRRCSALPGLPFSGLNSRRSRYSGCLLFLSLLPWAVSC